MNQSLQQHLHITIHPPPPLLLTLTTLLVAILVNDDVKPCPRA